jgi:hypothetical protein
MQQLHMQDIQTCRMLLLGSATLMGRYRKGIGKACGCTVGAGWQEELHQYSQMRLIRWNTNTRTEHPSTNLETVINEWVGRSKLVW